MNRHHHLSSAHEYGGGIKSWAMHDILTQNYNLCRTFSYKFVLKVVPKPPLIRLFGFLFQESQNNNMNLKNQIRMTFLMLFSVTPWPAAYCEFHFSSSLFCYPSPSAMELLPKRNTAHFISMTHSNQLSPARINCYR